MQNKTQRREPISAWLRARARLAWWIVQMTEIDLDSVLTAFITASAPAESRPGQATTHQQEHDQTKLSAAEGEWYRWLARRGTADQDSSPMEGDTEQKQGSRAEAGQGSCAFNLKADTILPAPQRW